MEFQVLFKVYIKKHVLTFFLVGILSQSDFSQLNDFHSHELISQFSEYM